ncbi:MAG: DEAD/DEAH box helicase, partial [Pseudomonadota bacterium]
MSTSELPVASVLPALTTALEETRRAVLTAPPGAGKTTLVPLALIEAGVPGRIVMLEPRRLAARAAAARMAQLRGEELGATVGYRIRGEAKTSAATRIEVVTEGVLTRMIQSDPSLEGVGAVIFDEFHERSIHADLGLALALEAQAALREDLRLLVMSATLDADPIATLMGGALVIRSEGRAHPVSVIWAETSWRARPGARLETAVAALIRRAYAEESGDILAFLPGEGEIRRTAAALGDIGADADIRPLYGAMRLADQRAALEPAPAGRRKIALATS